MNEGKELWEKYCGFFDKSFSEQVEYSEKKKKEYFEKWKNTKMARQLSPEGVQKLEDVPLTTYEDYPILHQFAKEIEKLENAVPRRKGELLWDYYDRIGRQASPILSGWMVDSYGFCLKTTGTTGKSRWFPWGESFLQSTLNDCLATIILGGSDEWGTTRLAPGDRFLNMLAPAPYTASVLSHALATELELVPPMSVLDEITDMRKKIGIAIKTVERGEKIDVVGGIGSSIKMVCEYFTKPDELYKNYYKSMKPGAAKVFLYSKYLRHRLGGRKYRKAKDILPAKVVGCGGMGAKLYFNYFKEQFEIEPGHGYGATETGYSFLCPPERKECLFPVLRTCYFEWLAESGKIKRLDELSKNETYEFVATPFGSMVFRFRMGDLFKVVEYRSDGLPYFEFEGRKIAMLDFLNYFRISEAIATDAMIKAGLQAIDKWCVQKVMEPREHLLVLMENVWDLSEEEAERKIFEALRTVLPSFQSYVDDFRVRRPSEILKVEYLRKGAFMRYSIRKVKDGVPMGQIKLPKIIPEGKPELADLLRTV